MSLRIFAFFLLIITLGCTQKPTPAGELLAHLPSESSVLIKINDGENLISELNSSNLVQLAIKEKLPKKVDELLRGISLNSTKGEQLLALSGSHEDSVAYLYLAKQAPDSILTSSAKNKSVETITSAGHDFIKYEIEDLLFFTTKDRGIFKMSNSLALLKDNVSAVHTETDQTLKTLYETANLNKSSNIFLKLTRRNPFVSYSPVSTGETQLPLLSEWVALDTEISRTSLRLNGVGIISDSSSSMASLLRDTGTLPTKTPAIAPENILAMVSFAFQHKKILDKNLNAFRDSVEIPGAFQTVEEVGVVYFERSKAIMLHTYGAENLNEVLATYSTTSENIQGSEIFELRENDILANAFNPFIANFSPRFYTVLENTFIFGQDSETVQEIIASYSRKSTFDNNPAYKTVRTSLADESNMMLIASQEGLERIAEDGFSIPTPILFQSNGLSDYIFALQLIAEDNYFHTTLIAQEEQAEEISDNNWNKAKFNLQSKGITDPQFVTNHLNGKKEVVVQDENYRLYLIDPQNGIRWTKQLDGPIQGEIQQVDLYKNGRLQLAFTTDQQFLILDRNGKEVAPFTFTYAGGNLNPLAVFDYNKDRNYRFVVTQGETVRMYNSKGKIVKGFKYTAAPSAILKAPKHFRISGRDYLVFLLENGQLEILSRVGKTRVPVNKKMDFSDNEVFDYKGNFTITEKDGNLVLIDPRGKITERQLNLAADHGWAAKDNLLTYTNENLITIGNKEVSLDYGVFTRPKILTMGKKVFITVTDLQSRQVFLLETNGKQLSGFPVYGSSVADLADWNKDGKPDLVTLEGDTEIVIYSKD
ncbi:MAG: ribonuclease HII [Flavobacteriaceae bacterium]|nr:ribonuclease HII [Flavobacteriaceae bacterium]